MSLLMSTTSTEIVQLGVGTSLHLQLSTKEVTTTSGIANIANDVKCMENANGSRHGNSHNLVQHAQDSIAGLLLVGTKALASEGSSYAATRSGNCRGCRTRKKNGKTYPVYRSLSDKADKACWFLCDKHGFVADPERSCIPVMDHLGPASCDMPWPMADTNRLWEDRRALTGHLQT